MAKEKDLQTGVMFEKLIQLGLIRPIDGPKKWELTEKGTLLGGRYNKNPDFRDYIEWPTDLELNQQQNSPGDLSKSIKNHYSNNQKSENTEGEIYIKEFLREIGIKFEYQKKISNLSNDVKSYRVADFYLPKYDVYVEFLGHWNTNDELKENYKIKKKVYRQNNIACVYLWPENLGFIHFAFDQRIIETLKENHRTKSLSKYKKWKWFKGSSDNLLGLFLCVALYFIMLAFKEQGKAVVFVLFFYNFYKIVTNWYLIYVKDSYSINRMLYD